MLSVDGDDGRAGSRSDWTRARLVLFLTIIFKFDPTVGTHKMG